MTEEQQRRARLWAAAQSDDDLRAALDENISLRTQLADLRGENAALRTRLARSLESERQLRQHRPMDLRGAAVALWDAMKGRTS
jgi:hypothetical protein